MIGSPGQKSGMLFETLMVSSIDLSGVDEQKQHVKLAIEKLENDMCLLEEARLEATVIRALNLSKEMQLSSYELMAANMTRSQVRCQQAKALLDEALQTCFELGHDIQGVDTKKLIYYNEQVLNVEIAKKRQDMQKYFEDREAFYLSMESRQMVKSVREQMHRNEERKKELGLETAMGAMKIEKSIRMVQDAEERRNAAKAELVEQKKCKDVTVLKEKEQQLIAQLKTHQSKDAVAIANTTISSKTNQPRESASKISLTFNSFDFMQHFHKERERVASPRIDFFSFIKNCESSPAVKRVENVLSTQPILRHSSTACISTVIDKRDETLKKSDSNRSFTASDVASVTHSLWKSNAPPVIITKQKEMDVEMAAEEAYPEDKRTSIKHGKIQQTAKDKLEVPEQKIEILENLLIKKAETPGSNESISTSKNNQQTDSFNFKQHFRKEPQKAVSPKDDFICDIKTNEPLPEVKHAEKVLPIQSILQNRTTNYDADHKKEPLTFKQHFRKEPQKAVSPKDDFICDIKTYEPLPEVKHAEKMLPIQSILQNRTTNYDADHKKEPLTGVHTKHVRFCLAEETPDSSETESVAVLEKQLSATLITEKTKAVVEIKQQGIAQKEKDAPLAEEKDKELFKLPKDKIEVLENILLKKAETAGSHVNKKKDESNVMESPDDWELSDASSTTAKMLTELKAIDEGAVGFPVAPSLDDNVEKCSEIDFNNFYDKFLRLSSSPVDIGTAVASGVKENTTNVAKSSKASTNTLNFDETINISSVASSANEIQMDSFVNNTDFLNFDNDDNDNFCFDFGSENTKNNENTDFL